VSNNLGINIRIIKFSSDFLINQGGVIITKEGKEQLINTKRNDIRFYMTMGYEKFSFDLAVANINFCPYCGTNLHKFYNKDEYANEIEGETFKL
jgi:transcription initiation factor IIE alpha subunit